MIKYVEYLKDFIGNNYVGVNIYHNEALPFLNKLKTILDDDYEEYLQYQQERDHGQHHITVINVMEYNKLAKELGMSNLVNRVEKIFEFEFTDLKFMGIGTAERGGNRTYFVVVQSDQLQAARKSLGLPEQDFHITLGFKFKDVFGVRKNVVLEDFDPFLKLLAQNYYINENFNFVRDIENFQLNPEDEIIPINISKSYLKVLCGDYYMEIGWLDDNQKFWIMSKYSAEEKLPRLSQNEIAKILKK